MSGEKQECYLTFEPKAEHMFLIKNINSLSGGPDIGQQAPLQNAIAYLLKLSDEKDEEELAEILKIASKTKVAVCQEVNIPRAIKVGVRKSEIETIENIFRNTFNILKIQRPFLARVLLTVYFLHIKAENAKLGVSEEPVSIDIVEDNFNENPDSLLRFNVSVEISNMLLKNEGKDKEYIIRIIEIMRQRGR